LRDHVQIALAPALGPEVQGEHQARLQHQSQAYGVERAAVAVDRGESQTEGEQTDLDALVEDEAALDPPHAGGLLGPTLGR
jgi:hypothetical protein